MNMRKSHIKAAIIAFLVALPLIFAANYLVFSTFMNPGDVWNDIGKFGLSLYIFALGLPLTALGYFFFPENGAPFRSSLVFMSVTSLCFLIQWIIWSQLIVVVLRLIVRKRELS